jgi:hypothetical protein
MGFAKFGTGSRDNTAYTEIIRSRSMQQPSYLGAFQESFYRMAVDVWSAARSEQKAHSNAM